MLYLWYDDGILSAFLLNIYNGARLKSSVQRFFEKGERGGHRMGKKRKVVVNPVRTARCRTLKMELLHPCNH